LVFGETRKTMVSLAAATILVVEDEALIRLDLQAILAAFGATVVEAESIARARALVARTIPQAAVLDSLVPDGDTFGLARDLLAAGIRVLFVTGIADGIPADLHHCPVVGKPFAGDQLTGAVAALLGRR
jgi:DNA-binding response OmpR family regulator